MSDAVVGPIHLGDGLAYMFHAVEGKGFMISRSEDGGATWEEERVLDDARNARYDIFYKPELDGLKGRMILGRVTSDHTLAINYLDPVSGRTREDGWVNLLHTNEVHELNHVVMLVDPLGCLVVSAKVFHYAEDKDVMEMIVWRSQDGGDTWQQVTGQRSATIH